MRLALGATAAAAALALGGTFTAHADNSGPAPEKADKIKVIVCAEPDPVEDPVDAEPGGKTAPAGNAKDAKGAKDTKNYEFTGEDPVDAEPGDGCFEDPEPVGDPVEAVPGGDDLGKPDSYVDVEFGTVKH
ncbi:hypothetical protein ACIHFB_42820 [Streptomyces sp. NPDC051963]|uniref:hypothetical protein n=1 Tax=Streptomyces sp. NPDC051963 TaxID=3365678 RepID=UPI0037D6FB3E